MIIVFIFELFLIYIVCTNLVNALRFCPLPAILSLSLLWGVVVVMVALAFNNQVNKNFQYKLLKPFVPSTVGFHNPIKNLCKSFHYFFSAVNVDYLCYALVIARFRVQYDQYFPSFSYFADLFHEPLGEWNKSKIWEMRKILAILCKIIVQ